MQYENLDLIFSLSILRGSFAAHGNVNEAKLLIVDFS